jgi:hypothetical protein
MNSKGKTSLDFVIIGAQKSGTTTLFRYLAEHPAIYMPPEKETPFFSYDEYFEKGWDWFLQGAFGDAPPDTLWGKASPQYMCFPQVPKRMAQQIPRVKCIAILRDPISRAYSHYRMSVRRGYESRSFEECIQTQLTAAGLEEGRLSSTPVNSYIAWGEYGRILSAYTRHFPREQMLILYTKDLASNPQDLLMKTYAFLGVGAVLPQTLGQTFHKGGTRTKLSFVTKLLRQMPVQAIRRRFPLQWWRVLERWYFAFEQWNMIPEDAKDIPLSDHGLRAVQDHFAAEAAILKSIVSEPPPWLPFPSAPLTPSAGHHDHSVHMSAFQERAGSLQQKG